MEEGTGTPGQTELLQQRCKILQEETQSSPWTIFCGETLTGEQQEKIFGTSTQTPFSYAAVAGNRFSVATKVHGAGIQAEKSSTKTNETKQTRASKDHEKQIDEDSKSAEMEDEEDIIRRARAYVAEQAQKQEEKERVHSPQDGNILAELASLKLEIRALKEMIKGIAANLPIKKPPPGNKKKKMTMPKGKDNIVEDSGIHKSTETTNLGKRGIAESEACYECNASMLEKSQEEQDQLQEAMVIEIEESKTTEPETSDEPSLQPSKQLKSAIEADAKIKFFPVEGKDKGKCISQQFGLVVGDGISDSQTYETEIANEEWGAGGLDIPRPNQKLSSDQVRLILKALSTSYAEFPAIVDCALQNQTETEMVTELEDLITTQITPSTLPPESTSMWNPAQHIQENPEDQLDELADDQADEEECAGGITEMGGAEDYDGDDYKNPYQFKVRASLYRAQNPVTKQWNLPIGVGLMNGPKAIRPGVHILSFEGGEWISQEEAVLRETRGQGGYFMLGRHNWEERYDMYAARKKGELASAVNSPANLRRRDQQTRAYSNCRLTYHATSKRFGLVTTKTIHPHEEMFYSYGSTYKLQIAENKIRERDLHLSQVSDNVYQVLAEVEQRQFTSGPYTITLAVDHMTQSNPEILTILQEITDKTSRSSIREALARLGKFTCARTKSAVIEDNPGRGYCGWATLFQGALEQRPDTTVPKQLFPGCSSTPTEIFLDKLKDYLENGINRNDGIYGKQSKEWKSTRAKVEEVNKRIEMGESLPTRLWATGGDLMVWDPHIPKSLWSLVVTKDSEMEGLVETTERTGGHVVDFNEIVLAIKGQQIINQPKADHYVRGVRQPHLEHIDAIIEEITQYVQQVFVGLHNALNAHA